MALKKFVKFNSEKGYLDNKDDINYYASQLMRKVAFGGMLGDFDENGLYVVKQKIVEELISMPKVIVEIVGDSDLIRSTVKGDAFFHFILSVENNKATLKLLEKIPYQSNRDFNTGVYSDINEYILDEVEIPDKDFNRNALYDKYNISTEAEGEALSLLDADEETIALYYNLIQKLKINYLVQNAIVLKEKDIEEIEADYFEAMLGVLAEYEEYGAKVKESTQEALAEKHSFVLISRPFFQQTINEVLDSHIEQHLSILSPEQKEQFLLKVRDIKAQYYDKFKKLVPMQIDLHSGVRFDNAQILEQGIIGALAQEVITKGFTSSDVRKVVIDESELQLPLNKIKDNVNENKEAAKRDNAGAKEITNNRKRTQDFYKEIETKQKASLLTPDSTLISTAISEKTEAKEVNNQKAKVSVAGSNSVSKTTNPNKNQQQNKKVANVNKITKAPTVNKSAPSKKPDQKKQVNATADKKGGVSYSYSSYGSSSNGKEGEQAKTAQPAEVVADPMSTILEQNLFNDSLQTSGASVDRESQKELNNNVIGKGV